MKPSTFLLSCFTIMVILLSIAGTVSHEFVAGYIFLGTFLITPWILIFKVLENSSILTYNNDVAVHSTGTPTDVMKDLHQQLAKHIYDANGLA